MTHKIASLEEKAGRTYIKEGLSNFRVVNAFLINAKGEVWIPRRTAHKRIFPLCLDMSVGGHVQSGESYEHAFRRELTEELGIDGDAFPTRVLGKFTPTVHGVSAFMTVYEIQSDQTPQYNPDDFIEHYWLAPAAVLERIARGDCAKSDLPRLIALLYPPRT